MDINRGLARTDGCQHPPGVSAPRCSRRSFAEWYSIDPPFPDGIFGEEKIVAGAYCNGGIMPLVGGELARAAFEHGFEEYGLEQLLKVLRADRLRRDLPLVLPRRKSTPRWKPARAPRRPPPTAGVLRDAVRPGGRASRGGRYRGPVPIGPPFPRWIAAGCDVVEVSVSYAASGASFAYAFAHDRAGKKIALHITGTPTSASTCSCPGGRVHARSGGTTGPCGTPGQRWKRADTWTRISGCEGMGRWSSTIRECGLVAALLGRRGRRM